MQIANFNERKLGRIHKIRICSTAAGGFAQRVKFQAYFSSCIKVHCGGIRAGVEHHVEGALSVDLHLKNDLIPIEVKGHLNNLLLPTCSWSNNGHRYQQPAK